jgi:ArsR family transcriptional regulator
MRDECTTMFQALADGTRLKILELLKRETELCVSDIAKHFDMKQPSISHHLDVLKRAGLVTSEKRGREVYYSFNTDAIVECCGSQLRVFDLELRLMKDGKGARVVMGKGCPVVSADGAGRDDT